VGTTYYDQLTFLINRLETTDFSQLYTHLMTNYGSLQLTNGLAEVLVLCDGSASTWPEQLDLPMTHLTGQRATIVMQLAPAHTEHWPDFAQQRVTWLQQSALMAEEAPV
jgi:hypothetical protein